MKEVKKILKSMLFAVVLFSGILTVEAKTYTSYKEGDVITVKVNDKTNIEFYVTKDSDSSNETVSGLLKNVDYDAKYNYTDAVKQIENYKTEWNNVTNVDLPDIEELLGVDVSQDNSESDSFEEPKYAISVSYWTKNESVSREGWHWVIANTIDNTGVYGIFEDDSEVHIRPVINVSKEHVIGGITITEDEKVWTEFIEKFKTTSVYLLFEDEVELVSTDNTLKVILTNNGETFTTNFAYENGILTYVPADTDEQKSVDTFWIGAAIEALTLMKGYDYEKVGEWLENNSNLTLAKDGIEFVEENLTIKGESSIADVTLTTNGYLSFKLDLKNGLKTYKTSEDKTETPVTEPDKKDEIENPSTGATLNVVLLLAGLSAGIVIVYKSKRKNIIKKI